MTIYAFASALIRCGFFFSCATALVILTELLLLEKTGREGPASPIGARLSTLLRYDAGRAVILFSAAVLTTASAILLLAFVTCDFVVEYVAQYSDLTLPLFYRITAFWAGQAGSMLFWALAVSLGGAAFAMSKTYRSLSLRTRQWFCLLFTSVMAFFHMLLSVWVNPFVLLDFTPADGMGLNPLLQDPGMIFHPPLLLLGYGGFALPACLALAQNLGTRTGIQAGGDEDKAVQAAIRPIVLVSWSLLSTGIILGAWWAYMELGWGGYWAWDPVENASLLPWFAATAYLHTSVIERRRGKLRRVNIFLLCLITVCAFFATYLVRSGVVQSLHAFGDSGIGAPLLAFALLFLFIAAVAPLACARNGETLDEVTSREGLLMMASWLLLAVGAIILIATLWPVILNGLRGISLYLPALLSAKIPQTPMGLEASFYNRTCLPLLALLSVLLLFCPGRVWKDKPGRVAFLHPRILYAVLALAGIGAICLWAAGIRHPVALLAAACSIAGIFGIILHFAAKPSRLAEKSFLAAHVTHLGLLMVILGVAFSGPYQQKYTLELGRGQVGAAGRYRVTVNELYEGESRIGADGRPGYRFLEAELLISSDKGARVGKLSPQRRFYAKFERQSYAEAATIFSPGEEIYAVLLGVDEESQTASLAVNVNPLVNWLWFGGALMCIFPLVLLRRRARLPDDIAQTARPPAE
ncbi:MAG: cytochrome c biogenesis protein CcsA [Desulfovibrio sp.]|jgi:cytochrome c-type biogenesis protein CcmF|nr:cytochrome c biogenesis protein CcsA [Desulfovibrio sp.]